MPAMRLRDDELALYDALGTGAHGRRAIYALGMHPKRAYYVLLKWTGKGWWEYGVAAELGWFTEAAPPTLRVEPHLTGRHARTAPAPAEGRQLGRQV